MQVGHAPDGTQLPGGFGNPAPTGGGSSGGFASSVADLVGFGIGGGSSSTSTTSTAATSPAAVAAGSSGGSAVTRSKGKPKRKGALGAMLPDGPELSAPGKVALGALGGAVLGQALQVPGRWFTGAVVGGVAGYFLSTLS